MDLTNDDVDDILALLDSLPYDSLDVQTPRFRLTLRRAAGGGWNEESEVLTGPTVIAPGPEGAPAPSPGSAGTPAPAPPDISGTPGETAQAPATATARADGTDPAAKADAAAGAARAAGTDGAAGAAGPEGTGGASEPDGLTAVAAPLPGTFYRAPRPGADPFVQVGDAVSPDTVVAIIETMKLMNSVHAGSTGRVSRICLDNGEFAPAGTVLMLIEPTA